MFDIPRRTRLADVTRTLVDTAMGRVKADLVVQNASLVNVNSGEVLEKQGIATKGDRIATFGDVEHTIGPNTEIVDAKGK